jgi:hypothetical protein
VPRKDYIEAMRRWRGIAILVVSGIVLVLYDWVEGKPKRTSDETVMPNA